jgi:hypothetical protein
LVVAERNVMKVGEGTVVVDHAKVPMTREDLKSGQPLRAALGG